MNKMKIKKGDEVIITCGKDKGRKGEVLRAMPKERKLLVKGVNVVKRHTKPTQTSPGGIVSKELPISVSNASLIDPKDGKPTRVGYKTLKDGSKVRFAKRSGEAIDKA